MKLKSTFLVMSLIISIFLNFVIGYQLFSEKCERQKSELHLAITANIGVTSQVCDLASAYLESGPKDFDTYLAKCLEWQGWTLMDLEEEIGKLPTDSELLQYSLQRYKYELSKNKKLLEKLEHKLEKCIQ